MRCCRFAAPRLISAVHKRERRARAREEEEQRKKRGGRKQTTWHFRKTRAPTARHSAAALSFLCCSRLLPKGEHVYREYHRIADSKRGVGERERQSGGRTSRVGRFCPPASSPQLLLKRSLLASERSAFAMRIEIQRSLSQMRSWRRRKARRPTARSPRREPTVMLT